MPEAPTFVATRRVRFGSDADFDTNIGNQPFTNGSANGRTERDSFSRGPAYPVYNENCFIPYDKARAMVNDPIAKPDELDVDIVLAGGCGL